MTEKNAVLSISVESEFVNVNEVKRRKKRTSCTVQLSACNYKLCVGDIYNTVFPTSFIFPKEIALHKKMCAVLRRALLYRLVTIVFSTGSWQTPFYSIIYFLLNGVRDSFQTTRNIIPWRIHKSVWVSLGFCIAVALFYRRSG